MSIEILLSVILVTGALVFFLQSDKAFLFGLHPCRFLVTEQTEAEIYAHHPEHIAKYEEALAANHIEKVRVDNANAVQAFVKFKAKHCLSSGECETLAASIQENAAIMVEDSIVIKLMQTMMDHVKFFTSKQMIAELNVDLANLGQPHFLSVG
jgi:hypothetical protein